MIGWVSHHANHVHPAGAHHHASDDVSQGLWEAQPRRQHASHRGAHAEDHEVPQEIGVEVQQSGVPLFLLSTTSQRDKTDEVVRGKRGKRGNGGGGGQGGGAEKREKREGRRERDKWKERERERARERGGGHVREGALATVRRP